VRAESLSDLLQAGDRVAVSNITGREASSVSAASQKYCGNLVGGWALGKGGQTIDVPGQQPIAVYATAEELMTVLPKDRRPNKVIVYSPPPAVYGEIKSVVDHGNGAVDTVFVITEHVSIEVSAKIAQLCQNADIDVLGCNCLGMINTHDAVRVGAVGGDNPSDSFRPGCAAVLSNSGNMVNTMASYLQNAGLGTSYGVSTGKDELILMPVKDLLALALADARTRLIVLYIEPGGLYEADAIDLLRQAQTVKPIIAYVAGSVLGTREIALGHAGAVVQGGQTSAEAKMKLFDAYFGCGPFEAHRRYRKTAEFTAALSRGIRISTLHHLPVAAALVCERVGIPRDFRPAKAFRLNPWFADYKQLGKKLPRALLLHSGTIPKPYYSQVKALTKDTLGVSPARRNMRGISAASSNDGRTTRLYGHSLEKEMNRGHFGRSLMLAWTGLNLGDFEAELVERCLIASLTNGPGTISAQGAKLSTSAGNAPNTAMIATLACIGDVHGGNGRRAVDYLIEVFRDSALDDPHDPNHGLDIKRLADAEAETFAVRRRAAKEAGTDYKRIPCLGHPVFRNDPVNYDPRERVIAAHIEQAGRCNVFLEFYHHLAGRLKEIGIARNVWAVNLDGAIASVVLGACWRALKDKRITLRRVCDIAFMLFAVGRVAGAGGEFLDHQDFGSPMDMRMPVEECTALTRPKDE